MQVLNSIAIASGYAGCDSQGGTSDEIFFLASTLLNYKEWLKIFFLLHNGKEKNGVTIKLERM